MADRGFKPEIVMSYKSEAVAEDEAQVESNAASDKGGKVNGKLKTILQVEIKVQIAAIHDNIYGVKSEVKWKGLLAHVAALLNLPESH
jgi:hypothetical protein